MEAAGFDPVAFSAGGCTLKFKPPGPREPSPCRAPHRSAAKIDVYPRAARLLHQLGSLLRAAPVSSPHRPLRPSRHSSTVLPSFLCAPL